MLLMLFLPNDPTLLSDFNSPSLQILCISRAIHTLIMARHQIRRISKQVIHLLKRQVLGLRQKQIEEQRVREVADDKEVVVSIPDVRHCRAGNLPDQGVEGEGYHGSDRDTFGAGARVEDLGRDDPRKRPAGRGEGEVVEPRADYEAPRCRVIIRRSGWEFGNEDTCNEEADHVEEISGDQGTSASELVDEQDAAGFSDESDDVVDCLVFEGVWAAYTNLAVDLDTVVLNCGYTGHLDGGLEGAGNK